jgi:hypothetical protein
MLNQYEQFIFLYSFYFLSQSSGHIVVAQYLPQQEQNCSCLIMDGENFPVASLSRATDGNGSLQRVHASTSILVLI